MLPPTAPSKGTKTPGTSSAGSFRKCTPVQIARISADRNPKIDPMACLLKIRVNRAPRRAPRAAKQESSNRGRPQSRPKHVIVILPRRYAIAWTHAQVIELRRCRLCTVDLAARRIMAVLRERRDGPHARTAFLAVACRKRISGRHCQSRGGTPRPEKNPGGRADMIVW